MSGGGAPCSVRRHMSKCLPHANNKHDAIKLCIGMGIIALVVPILEKS